MNNEILFSNLNQATICTIIFGSPEIPSREKFIEIISIKDFSDFINIYSNNISVLKMYSDMFKMFNLKTEEMILITKKNIEYNENDKFGELIKLFSNLNIHHIK